jgi:hypothetical protein
VLKLAWNVKYYFASGGSFDGKPKPHLLEKAWMRSASLASLDSQVYGRRKMPDVTVMEPIIASRASDVLGKNVVQLFRAIIVQQTHTKEDLESVIVNE